MVLTQREHGSSVMEALQLVRLVPLMSCSQGRAAVVVVALIDSPVALEHPDLAQSRIKEIPATCALGTLPPVIALALTTAAQQTGPQPDSKR
jgi:hypothetical protein